MSEETSPPFNVPISCPFTIQEIDTSGLTNSKTYLIREHDQYGEFPHIYAKICGILPPSATANSSPSLRHSKVCRADGIAIQNVLEGYKVIVLSDTGCGTEVPRSSSYPFPPAPDAGEQKQSNMRAEPEVWNIRTFLEYTINPGGRIPYLVMTTHCHYDHIMGIGKLPPTSATTEREDGKNQTPGNVPTEGSARTPTTVLSSSYDKAFVTPYSNLQNHSLCDKLTLHAPRYDVAIWAKDMSRVVFTHPTISSSSSTATSSPSPHTSIATPLTILHTPGHTPDSLSWYDSDLRLLCVGDSFYVKETPATQKAKWGREPPMPVIFDLESDLGQWWRSLKKVLDFVRERNAECEKEDTCEDGLGEILGLTTTEDSAAAEDDNDGFVYIDAQDVAPATWEKEEELDSRERTGTIVQPRPVDAPRERADAEATPGKIATGKQEKSRPQAQQTGFDIPSPSRRGVIALPILSTPRGRLTAAGSDKADDVWMMVVDPVARPRPQHTPDRPARLRLEPVILPQRLHPRPPTASFWKDKKDMNPMSPHRTFPAPKRPRVRLCAAHTTLSIDAEWAILSMQRFMKRILENDVPCRRAADGPRGEERWIWDDALSSRLDATAREEIAETMKRTRHDDDHNNDNDNGGGGVRSVLRDLECAELERGHGDELDRNAPQPTPNKHEYKYRSRPRYTSRTGYGGYSVLAPLSVIEDGRRRILGGPAGVV